MVRSAHPTRLIFLWPKFLLASPAILRGLCLVPGLSFGFPLSGQSLGLLDLSLGHF